MDRAHRRAPVAIAAVILLAAMLIGASWTSIAAGRELAEHERWYVHTLDVLATSDRAELVAANMLRGERGYVLTGQREYLEPYFQGSNRLPLAVAELGRLTADNPAQRPHIARIAQQADRLKAATSKVIQAQRQGQTQAAIATIKAGEARAAMLKLSEALSEIKQTERKLLAVRDVELAAARQRLQTLSVVVALGGMATLILALLAISALRKAFAREAAYRAKLRSLADTDELTGIANRRETMAAVERAIADARRRQEPLAVAVMDIDKFKTVNDTYRC